MTTLYKQTKEENICYERFLFAITDGKIASKCSDCEKDFTSQISSVRKQQQINQFENILGELFPEAVEQSRKLEQAA